MREAIAIFADDCTEAEATKRTGLLRLSFGWVWLLVALLQVSCAAEHAGASTAFHALPLRIVLPSTPLFGQQPQRRSEATSLRAAGVFVKQDKGTALRANAKKALLELVGFGVIDRVAYQTFTDPLLPPKLRPTTRVRVAEGVHSYLQEFLGFPPQEGVSSFSKPALPVTEEASRAADAESGALELQPPKIPAVGSRMTVVRLCTGELLFHSPAAPTVELLDMLKDVFPAIGPTSKVHLVSPSLSPEHWVYLRHWKEIFPSAEVWSVLGPHRRLMGVEVDHDLEHSREVPEKLGGEVKVAVLEGVPMVQEALILHRPTRTLLSANLLIAMDQAKGATNRGVGVFADASARGLYSSSTPPRKRKFGDESPAREALVENQKAWGRRFHWWLFDRTTSLLGMKTLAVLPPFKTVLVAIKGNSADFSARVLSWDVWKFVGSHGQSPVEGPELKVMIRSALGRYTEVASEPQKGERKRVGGHLRTILPEHRRREADASIDGATTVTSAANGPLGSSNERDNPCLSGGGGGACVGAALESTEGSRIQVAAPHADFAAAPPGNLRAAAEDSVADSSPTSPTLPGKGRGKTVPPTASTVASRPHAASRGGSSTAPSRAADKYGRRSVDASMKQTAQTTTATRSHWLPAKGSSLESSPVRARTAGRGVVGLGAMFAEWSISWPHATSKSKRGGKNDLKKPFRIPDPTSSENMPGDNASTAAGNTIDSETRARRYVAEIEARATGKAVTGKRTDRSSPCTGNEDSLERLPPWSFGGDGVTKLNGEERRPEIGHEGRVTQEAEGGARDPYVKAADVSYDKRAVGPLEDSDDPFKKPFYPFKDSSMPSRPLEP